MTNSVFSPLPADAALHPAEVYQELKLANNLLDVGTDKSYSAAREMCGMLAPRIFDIIRNYQEESELKSLGIDSPDNFLRLANSILIPAADYFILQSGDAHNKGDIIGARYAAEQSYMCARLAFDGGQLSEKDAAPFAECYAEALKNEALWHVNNALDRCHESTCENEAYGADIDAALAAMQAGAGFFHCNALGRPLLGVGIELFATSVVDFFRAAITKADKVGDAYTRMRLAGEMARTLSDLGPTAGGPTKLNL